MSIAGPVRLKAQIFRDGQPAIGPGKALVLDAIAATGSISAAGRRLGMSYRRIWLLVDALNADWREPVVATRPGGGAGGGARLTPFGDELLRRFKAVERAMMAAADGEDLDWLLGMRRDAPAR